jgi:hypothetical protein
MIRCVWQTGKQGLQVKVKTFRPAAWLLPLLLFPCGLQAVTWNNYVNTLDGSPSGVSYTTATGTTTANNDGTLTLTSPDATNPARINFALPPVPATTGWIRFQRLCS